MSGSFFWRPADTSEYEWLSKELSVSPKLPLKFYLAAGLLETVVTPTNEGHYMLSTNRHLRNVLAARGYSFRYEEFSGGHEDLSWQESFAEGLAYTLKR